MLDNLLKDALKRISKAEKENMIQVSKKILEN